MKNFLLYIILFCSFSNLSSQSGLEDYVLDSAVYLNISNGTIFPVSWESYSYDSKTELSEIRYHDNKRVNIVNKPLQKISSYNYLDISGQDSVEYYRIVEDYNIYQNKIKESRYNIEPNGFERLALLDSLVYNDNQLLTEKYNTYIGGYGMFRYLIIHTYDNDDRKIGTLQYHYLNPNSDSLILYNSYEYVYDDFDLKFEVVKSANASILNVDSTQYFTSDNGDITKLRRVYSNGELVGYSKIENYTIDDVHFLKTSHSNTPFLDTLSEVSKTKISSNIYFSFDRVDHYDIIEGDSIKKGQDINSVVELENGNLRIVKFSNFINQSFGFSFTHVETLFYKAKNDDHKLSEDEGSLPIDLYPNPVRKGESLFFKEQVVDGTKVMIYNNLGQLAQKGSVENQAYISLDQNLIPGMYYIIFEKEGKAISLATPFVITN